MPCQIDSCTVFGFTDPQLALEHFKVNQEHHRLILSDLRMPGLTGIELIQKVKELKPNIKALLMSAFEVKDDLVFQQLRASDVVKGFIHH